MAFGAGTSRLPEKIPAPSGLLGGMSALDRKISSLLSKRDAKNCANPDPLLATS